jgi:EAL domain-containing protein (putative c-di-GMP-specific phosphodiesterase class I)
VPIGIWVIEQAFSTLKHWHKLGHKELKVSVNISYKQMVSGHLIQDIQEQLQRHQLKGNKVMLELTERVFAEDIDLVQRTVSELSNLGIQTAIDDFGIGFSSLSYLEKIPFGMLKIDKSFVDDINTSDSSRNLCDAIASMAGSLHLVTTAEGIESDIQFNALRQMNVNYFQGFLFARPVSSEAFLKQL